MSLLRKEVAYLAYHFHWSREEIFGMGHSERRAWVGEVAEINRKLNEARNSDEA